MDTKLRYQGSLLGLATGDALGTTLEFTLPNRFEPITDMIGGGAFHLKPGQWTDDTSMALCLAESLITCKGFDGRDQMYRYAAWYQDGYMSSTGRCFDVGNTTAGAIRRFMRTGNTTQPGNTHQAGNGSLMRLGPIPMAYARLPVTALAQAGESSILTHTNRIAVDACRYYAGLIVGALLGESKETLLGQAFAPTRRGRWFQGMLAPEIMEIASGRFKQDGPPKASGYVANTLEAALWAFYHTDTFREGALMAVNLGQDADTTGAVYGQLAGAYYGVMEIPAKWLGLLAKGELIAHYADQLYALALTL